MVNFTYQLLNEKQKQKECGEAQTGCLQISGSTENLYASQRNWIRPINHLVLDDLVVNLDEEKMAWQEDVHLEKFHRRVIDFCILPVMQAEPWKT